MPQQVPLQPGDPRRLGQYRLGGRIAGIPSEDPIFIGIDPAGNEVVVSLLRGDWARDAAARDRFAAEAAVAKRVPPFCAGRVLDAGLDEPGAYLVSVYIPGPSLLEVVVADGVRTGHDLEAVAIGMATGLASVHQAGLVHGNFGPEYVIMTSDGSPRVVEFGITPPYGTATPSADMLAWAHTVVFAASGRPPVSLDDLDVLPGHIRGLVQQCLDPEPAERPAARALLRSLLGGQDPAAGVLAEGSRRAGGRFAARYGSDPAPGAPQSARPQPPVSRPASRQQPYGAGHGRDDRPAAQGRSRHSQGRADPRRMARSAGPSRGPGRAGRARRAGWMIGAAVVVVAAVAAVVLHVVLGNPSVPAKSGGSGRLSATGTRSSSPSPSPSPSPSRGPVTPVAFAGSWTGLVRQPPTDTYNVSVTLRAGASSGTISYSGTDFSCSGALSLTSATTAELTLNQTILQGHCEPGTVRISRTGTNTIRFSFHSGGPVAAGSLDRS